MSGKKYIIKESELKEIIKEMILMEVYNPNDYAANYTSKEGAKAAAEMTPEVMFKNLGGALRGISNQIIPDSIKQRAENGDSRALEWILGVLGATNNGAVGPDIFRNLTNAKIFGGPGFMAGNNHDAHEVFDVQRATQWLREHSYPYYIKGKCGNCARRVREALNNGGLSAPWGMAAVDAKNYINILPNNGWTEIPVSEVGQLGDIVVLDAFVAPNSGKSHRSGHIAMFCGDQWISDFKQNNAFGMSGQVPANVVHYYRYTNLTTPATKVAGFLGQARSNPPL